METWRPVVGWEGFYEVSSLGRIRSVDRPGRKPGCIMKPQWSGQTGNKYLSVCLKRPGVLKRKYVHAMVCEAFHGKRPEGLQAAHRDNDRENNCETNVRWLTCKANIAEKVIHGTATVGSKNAAAQLDEDQVREIRRIFVPRHPEFGIRPLARKYAVSDGTIKFVVTFKTWAHVV